MHARRIHTTRTPHTWEQQPRLAAGELRVAESAGHTSRYFILFYLRRGLLFPPTNNKLKPTEKRSSSTLLSQFSLVSPAAASCFVPRLAAGVCVCAVLAASLSLSHEDRVRRVRARGGGGAVLRRRGRALPQLRRRRPLRQQARRQAPPRRAAPIVHRSSLA